MPSITDLRRPQETVTVEVRGIPVTVVYDPDAVTVRDSRIAAQAQRDGDVGAFTRLIQKMVIEWDITGPLVGEQETDDGEIEEVELVPAGEVIPVTLECMEALGTRFLGEFLGAIGDANTNDGKPTRATSPSRKR